MFNIYLILIVMNITFITIILELEHFYIYNKIFHNQQNLEDKKLNLDLALANLCKNSSNLITLGFLNDNLSMFNQEGLNVYKISLDHLYGYMGCRGSKIIDPNALSILQEYYKKKIANKGFNPEKLVMVSLDNSQVAYVFFLKDFSELWRYDISTDQFYLEYSNKTLDSQILNYNITMNNVYPYITSNNKLINYTLYLHLRENNPSSSANNTLDLLKNIKINNNTFEEHTIIASDKQIINFFLRHDQIIIVYQDLKLQPEIYKKTTDHMINHKGSLGGKINYKKDNIQSNEFKLLENSPCVLEPINAFGTAELVWVPEISKHKLNINYPCSKVSYLFNLKNDNYLLGYRADHG